MSLQPRQVRIELQYPQQRYGMTSAGSVCILPKRTGKTHREERGIVWHMDQDSLGCLSFHSARQEVFKNV